MKKHADPRTDDTPHRRFGAPDVDVITHHPSVEGEGHLEKPHL